MVSQAVAPQLLMSCPCALLAMVTEQGLCPLDQETTERLCRGLFLALCTTNSLVCSCKTKIRPLGTWYPLGRVTVDFLWVWSCVSTHSKNFAQFCYTPQAGYVTTLSDYISM